MHNSVYLPHMFVLLFYIGQAQTDDLEHIVGTTPAKVLHQGTTGSLPCDYKMSVFAVYWNKVDDLHGTTRRVVVFDQAYEGGERSGPGIDEGRFNITDDFSLIIRDVQKQDEGRYICEVSDRETGTVFRNFTIVTVSSIDINIEQCRAQDEESNDCEITIPYDLREVELDCNIAGIGSEVPFSWKKSGQRDQAGNVKTSLDRRDGGAFVKTLTLNMKGNEIKSGDIFICGPDEPIPGIGVKTVTVHKDQIQEISTNDPENTVNISSDPLDFSSADTLSPAEIMWIAILCAYVTTFTVTLLILLICCIRAKRKERSHRRDFSIKYHKPGKVYI